MKITKEQLDSAKKEILNETHKCNDCMVEQKLGFSYYCDKHRAIINFMKTWKLDKKE